jgi:hypothetical protein
MDAVTDPSSEPVRDPVREQRARIVGHAKTGQRVGLTLLLLFLVLTVVGLVTGLPGPVVTGMQVTLLGGTIILAPSILVAYMAKAAEREDRERGI